MKHACRWLMGSMIVCGTAAGPLGADVRTEMDPLPGTATVDEVVTERARLEGEYVPGEILLDMDDGLSSQRAQDVASRIQGVVESASPVMATRSIFKVRLHGRWLNDPVGAAHALQGAPGVAHAEPNWRRWALYKPNDPLYKHQWHMDQVRAPEAWDLTTGEGVTVAVLDTGIAYGTDPSAPKILRDLKGVKFVSPFNTLDHSTDANDRQGHGSHVAGTIAQNTNNGIGVVGVAYGVTLMPVKVLSDSGSGTLAGVVEGIYYAADKGAQVINMSLGSSRGSHLEEEACTYAFKKGVFIAAAAGNTGREGVGYPAACKDAVAVAAVRFDRTRTFYSSYGTKVALSAPGGDMRVDQNGDGQPDGVLQNTVKDRGTSDDFLYFQGTSMATPHVAGAAALVMAAGVKSPARVLAILQETAGKIEGDTHGMGKGIIDCFAAVQKARAEGPGPKPGGRSWISLLITLLFAALVVFLLWLASELAKDEVPA